MAADNVVRVLFEAYTEQFKRQVRELTGNTKELGERGEDAGRRMRTGFNEAETGAEKLNRTIGNIIKAAGAMYVVGKIRDLAAGISGWIGGSVSLYAEFEDSMKQVQATMGLTGQEGEEAFRKLSEAAKEAGATTRFTATDAADALNYLALAGYNTDQAIKAMPGVLSLAAAGGMDLARASDMVTDSMAALGIGMSGLDGYMDKMAKTSQKSNTNVAQLGEAILTVGGTAKNLSGGVTELNTSLGVLADVGIKGAEGGTALRNIILSLAAPSSKAAELLDRLGVATLDARGNIRPLNDIMTDLNKSFTGLGGGQRAQLLSEIFNVRDIKSVEALLSATNGRFKELSGLIDDSEGAMRQMADTMESGLAGSMRSLNSAYEGLRIEIAERFSGIGQNAVNKVTGIVRLITSKLSDGSMNAAIEAVSAKLSSALDNIFSAIDSFIDNGGLDRMLGSIGQIALTLADLFDKMLQNAPAAIEAVSGALSWLADNFSRIIDFVKEAVYWFISFKTAMAVAPIIAGVAGAIKVFITAVKGGTVAIKALGLAIKANPLGLLITALTIVITLLIKAYMTSETFRDIVKKAFDAVKTAVLIAIETVKLAVLGLAWLWISQFQLMANAVANLIGWIPGIGDAAKSAANVINGLMDGIDNRISNSVSNLQNLMNQTKKATTKTVTKLNVSNGSVNNEEKAGDEQKWSEPSISYETPAAGAAANNKSGGKTGGASTGAGSGIKDKRTAFEKGLDNVNDSYKTREELITSYISLEETQGNEKGKKSFQQGYIDMLKEKLMSLTGLDKLTASTDERNILETAKNKILTEIARITNDMKGNLDKLVGSFNAPSEFSPLTEYAYNVNTSNSSYMTRVISTPTLNMHLNVKDLGGASASDVRNRVNSFADAFMGKDDIVFAGMWDVLRN